MDNKNCVEESSKVYLTKLPKRIDISIKQQPIKIKVINKKNSHIT